MMDKMLETTTSRKKSNLRQFKVDEDKLRMQLEQIDTIS